MDMKAFVKTILILDKNRYRNKKLNGYIRLEKNIDKLDYIDSIVLDYVESIPKEIDKLDFRYYFVNFHTQYFDAMYLYCFIIMLIILPFVMAFNPFLIVIIPIVYCLISMFCNLVLTIIEIKRLRKKLNELYRSIKKKL